MRSADERTREITERLWELTKGDRLGGGADPDTVLEVRALVAELRTILPNQALALRLSGLVDAVEVACSPGRWRKAGIEHWRRIASEDAYVIMTHA
jgi:hypothetical protein